jgi:glycosyltransferase involved in cell wall biosynthesis
MIPVLLTHAQIKQYRLSFFTKLHAALQQDGIEMKVVYSDPPEVDKLKQDNVELPPEIGIKVPAHWFLGNRFLYQGLINQALRADLVIAEQANKNLHNYALLLLDALRSKRLAFWGQGGNHGLGRSGISEFVRPWVARRAAWWFTYTEGTASWLRSIGFPRERTTVLQNSTDTRALADQIAEVSDEQLAEVRQRLGIEPGSRVGIYCGALIKDKGIPVLLEATRLIRKRIPGFHLLILGAGPESERVQQAAGQAPWIHYLGPKFGEERAPFLKLSDCFLLPGYVGLAILDSFAAGLPLITTNVPFHAPEVGYLEEGINGRMTENNVEAYAESIAEILSDSRLLKQLKGGAGNSAERYSIEAMVEKFRSGVLQYLKLSGRFAAVAASGPACSGTKGGLAAK